MTPFENIPISLQPAVFRAAWDLCSVPVVVFDGTSGLVAAMNPAVGRWGYEAGDLPALEAARLLPGFPWQEFARFEERSWSGILHDRTGGTHPVRCRVRTVAEGGRILLVTAVEFPGAATPAAAALKLDPLTQLPDRTAIAPCLEHALERAVAEPAFCGALLFIDLDGFKAVNDRWGHLTGDRVLHEAARRIKAAVRPSDLAARLGGDEFVVVLEGLRHSGDAETVARRILAQFAAPIVTEEHSVTLTASIGIAPIGPGGRVETLLQTADRAMYQAKSRGGGTWHVA